MKKVFKVVLLVVVVAVIIMGVLTGLNVWNEHKKAINEEQIKTQLRENAGYIDKLNEIEL